MRAIIPLPVLIFPFIVTAAAAENFSIPLDSMQERLVVALWQGDILVVPGAGDTVLVTADCAAPDTRQKQANGSFRSLTSAATVPDVVLSDEIVSIRTREPAPACSLSITAAPQLDLYLRINRTGSIQVRGWSNYVQAWSAEGDVSLLAQRGSHSVTAMNGDASVSLEAPPAADSAVSAANGTLTLTVSGSALPALRAQARWGEVHTNLPAEFEEVVEAGGRWFVTEEGGNGPVLTLRNLNRDIVIRSGE